MNLVRLTNGRDSAPVWSPNGQHIVFLREEGGNHDLYIISTLKDGAWQEDTELTRLTQRQSEDHSPAWSPDSKTIAFVSVHDRNGEIYLMRADGSKQRRLTNNGADDLAPVWSPNGKRIAFVSYLYGAGEVFVMDVDSGKQDRLTNTTPRTTPRNGSGVAAGSNWSPQLSEQRPWSGCGSTDGRAL